MRLTTSLVRAARPRARLYARDVTEDLRGMLEPPIVRRRPCINDPRRLGKLLRAVDEYTGRAVTRIGLELAPLLFVRPSELRKAR